MTWRSVRTMYSPSIESMAMATPLRKASSTITVVQPSTSEPATSAVDQVDDADAEAADGHHRPQAGHQLQGRRRVAEHDPQHEADDLAQAVGALAAGPGQVADVGVGGRGRVEQRLAGDVRVGVARVEDALRRRRGAAGGSW